MNDYPQIVTQINENGVNLTTVVDAPWVSVTSLNGQTGDVIVEPIIRGFQANHYYVEGTAISYNGALYSAKTNFTSGFSFNASNWDSIDTAEVSWDNVTNKPNFATVATSGSYTDLSNTPNLATVATSGLYSDLSGAPNLATVATSGSYADLNNIPSDLVQDANYTHTDNNFTSTLLTKLNGIASGAEVNVQADWDTTSTSSDSYIMNKPTTLSSFTYDIIDKIYPVGSIYMSATLSTPTQVANALGGTWVAWGGGRVPVGMGSNGTSTYSTVEATGGSESHGHEYGIWYAGWYGTMAGLDGGDKIKLLNGNSSTWGRKTDVSGGSMSLSANPGTGASNTPASYKITADTTSGDTRQPYITVYMYKRTA